MLSWHAGFNLNLGPRDFVGQSVKSKCAGSWDRTEESTQHQFILLEPFISWHPSRSALRASETADASEPVAAVSIPQASRWFVPLDATVSLRSCPRGLARSGQDWRAVGNIGRWGG